MPSRHWLYFGGFLLSGVALAGIVVMGLLDAVSVLSGGVYYGEEALAVAMLAEAIEWVVAAAVVGLLALLLLVATLGSILRNESLPRSDRLVSIVERLEYKYPLLQEFDVSKRVEPTAEDRRQELKEQYVAGEIGDDEFEREMESLMDEDSSNPRP